MFKWVKLGLSSGPEGTAASITKEWSSITVTQTAGSSETVAHLYQTKRCHIPEVSVVHSPRRENFKFRVRQCEQLNNFGVFPYVCFGQTFSKPARLDGSLIQVSISNLYLYFGAFFCAQHPTWAQAASLLKFQEHTQNTPHSIGPLCTRDRPKAESLPDNTQHAKDRDIYVTSGT